jgi:phage/plasmid-like protein (TIGR03299 family)
MHAIAMDGDKAMMGYADEAPWHAGETNPTKVSDAAFYNSQLFMAESGLDWEVGKFQLQIKDTLESMNMYAVKRKMSDGTWKLLTDSRAVGARYNPLQNRNAFEWFDPFLQAKEARLHTAGALLEGSRIWVLAKLERDPIVVTPEDIVEKYLLLSHAHDGSLAIRVGFTPIRVVCYNTLSAAHSDKASKLIRVKHSKSMKSNLENIRHTMDVINQEFEATAEQYKLLASKQINQADVHKYVKRVFELDELKDEEIGTRSGNLMAKVEELFETGKGNTLPTVKGSYWAAYNGVTEYLSWDYAKPKNGEDTKMDSRLNSLWFGDNADMNQRALATAVEMAMTV